MPLNFKGKIFKTTLIIMCGFAVLFVFRFIYGYTSKLSESDSDYISDFFDELELSKKNYASDSYKFEKKEYRETSNIATTTVAAVVPKQEYDVNQKYEKTATVKTKTENFDTDKEKVLRRIKLYNAIIQFEQNSGRKGNRSLHLSIGVQPEKFDSFYLFIKSAGHVKSAEITKVDKTNEYKDLNAKRVSLEKIRESLLELKSRNGKIDEYINLQNRILEIETQLQALGVQLGDFDEENEFCTIKFSLIEGKTIPIGFMHRIKVAFEWSVSFYLMFLAIVALATFSAFFVLLIIDKLKILSSIIKRLNE